MKRSKLNLAPVPRVKKVAAAASIEEAGKISERAATDSAVVGYGSAIDIPRTSLAKGGRFGEVITPQALTFAVRREPVAKRLVMDIAGDIYDKWFKAVPIKAEKEGEKSETGNTLDQNVQTVLETLNAKSTFIEATQYERRYGWSIIVLGFKDNAALEEPAENPAELDHLAVYSPRAASVDKEDEDKESERFGLPVMYKINRGKNQTIKVHYTRVLHVATRLDEHPWAGISVLENIWDDMTVYRNIRWAAGQVYWRMAGLPVFTVPKNYKKAEIENFLSTLGDPNVRSFLCLPEDKKVEILSAEGRILGPEEFTDLVIRSISMGSSIPKQKLEGTEAGAVTGSEVNQREYYKYVSDQQKVYESEIVGPLIDLLMEINQIKPNIDYKIEWESAFELDSAMKAAAELADAQTAELELKYMMIDEVRAKRGIKPLTEVSGGKLDGQKMATPEEKAAPFWKEKLP
jgi:hypothetical protein